MYKRDVAILLVACFAVIFSLQHEGRISVRKAWYHLYEDDDPDLFNTHSKLPAPVVGDLNGDGDLEVIVATHDYKLEVVKPRPPGRNGDGFAKSRVLASVSLLPTKFAVAGSRRAAALAVGYLDAPPAELVRAPRKQVVVVVTAGWHVMCFDHNLKLLWEHAAVDHLPHHAQLEEVAIHISHHKIQPADRGLIVVGGSLLLGDLQDADTKDQLLQEEVRAAEDALNLHPHPARRLTAEDHPHRAHHHANTVPNTVAGADASRHFSYFAYEGGAGAQRWKHTAKFMHAAELQDLADRMHPQDNYKLEAESLEERHYEEASCRAYAPSVLRATPHLWDAPHHTRLHTAHFVKHREAAGAQRHSLGRPRARAHTRTPPGRPTGPHSPKLAGLLSKPQVAAALLRRTPAAAHPHHHHNASHPNAIVAHLRQGLEAIHLYSGRTLCQLHLPDGQLHVDIDGDGVLDHVQTYVGSAPAPLGDAGGATAAARHHRPAAHCTAVATSGIPPRHRVWSTKICGLEHADLLDRVMADAGGGGAGTGGVEPVREVLPPAFLPVPSLDGGYGATGRQHGILAFLSNKGELVATGPDGEVLWSGFFGVGWDPVVGGGGAAATLEAVALRPHAIPTAFLAAGAFSGVLVSEHGNALDQFSLPAPPVQPLVVADFNGDGLNDFVLVTGRGVFGYAQVHHLGGYSFSALVVTLVICMGLVWFMAQGDGAGGRGKKVRSTEYVD